MGLLDKPLPRVNIEDSGARAATGIMKRNVAPDSPQSIGSLADLIGLAPSTDQQSSLARIIAPKAITARTVASVSSETSGFAILEVPLDSAPAMSIRCVNAFDGGAQTSPLISAAVRITTLVNLSHDFGLFTVQL